MPRLKHLFSPLKISTLTLKNRIVMPAITTNFHQYGDESLVNYYAEIARGGVAMIIIGGIQAIYPSRRETGLSINKDEDIPLMKKLVRATHENGALACAQLAIWNYWARGGVGTAPEEVSPSGVVAMAPVTAWSKPQSAQAGRPLTIEEIHMIEHEYAESAVRAVEAGFDAIQVPARSGNLLSKFLIPYTNRRTDEYGGSLENRMRMLLEILTLVKQRIGNDFPLLCRIAGEDLMPWGLHLAEHQTMAPIIEKAGVHALDTLPAWYESPDPRDQMCVPQGFFVNLAEGIKEVVNIPVSTGVRLTDPVMADRIVAEGKADLISMGKPLIADTDLPNKAREGRFEDIRMCTACCNCWDQIVINKPLTCSVNARVGREAETRIISAATAKKVWVVGGGPGGMEAARIAATRGHKVTLFEKDSQLGGQLRIAALPPCKSEWKTTLNYLTAQIAKLGVEVILNREVAVKTIENEKPDAVIIAAGSQPLTPNIPGINGPNVIAVLDVLTGVKQTGTRVVVIGGGLVGCETAEFLHQQGKKVTIIETQSALAVDVGIWNRPVFLDRLQAAGIGMEVNRKVEQITGQGVITSCPDGQKHVYAADTVVIAAGMKPDTKLAKELATFPCPVIEIGACTGAGKVINAIHDGFEAGSKV